MARFFCVFCLYCYYSLAPPSVQEKTAVSLVVWLVSSVIIGGAVAVATDDNGDDSNTEGSAAVGAATGGLIGALICSNYEKRERAERKTTKRRVPPPPPAARTEDPNGDEDGDGVVNRDDICPGTDPKYDVDEFGCPLLLDTDRDGIPDEQDRCPDTPLGSEVDHEGCPLVGEKMVVLEENIHFAFNKSDLTTMARAVLDRLSDTMRERGSLRISIEGHTDNVGSDDYNEHLSRLRALSAYSYLTTQAGVDGSRLSVVSHGEKQPIASNDTEQGRSQNRRVEFIVKEQ